MGNWRTTLFGALVLATQVAGPFLPDYKQSLDNAADLLVGAGLVAAADAPRREKRARH